LIELPHNFHNGEIPVNYEDSKLPSTCREDLDSRPKRNFA
jgi:hypothetical protein